MGRVAGDDHAEAELLGLVDGHLHAAGGDDHAHAVVAVDDGGGGGLLHNLKVGDGVEDAGLDAVVVDELQTLNAVGVETTTVGLDENLPAGHGVLMGNPAVLENVDHETLEGGKVHCDFVRHFFLD